MILKTRVPLVALGCVAAVLLATQPSSAHGQADGELPIMTWDQSHPLLPETGGSPMVEVYASGLVRFHRPAGFKNPGVTELQLSQLELARLLELGKSARDADADAVRQVAPDGSEHFSFDSDPTVTTIELPRAVGHEARVFDDGTIASRRAATLQSITVEALERADDTDESVRSLKGIGSSMKSLFEQAGARHED